MSTRSPRPRHSQLPALTPSGCRQAVLSSTSDVTITVNAANTAPVVNAGTNQTITLPATANLSATASDDGLPNGTLTTTWSKFSGPGTVTFGSVNALITTATFSTSGT